MTVLSAVALDPLGTPGHYLQRNHLQSIPPAYCIQQQGSLAASGSGLARQIDCIVNAHPR